MNSIRVELHPLARRGSAAKNHLSFFLALCLRPRGGKFYRQLSLATLPILAFLTVSWVYAAPKAPDIVYLHECASDCSVKPGSDNAITHTSSLVTQAVTLETFPSSDDVFNQSAACTRSVLAPFDIHVLTNDPGPVARREIMMSTTSPEIGFPAGYPLAAPYSYPVLQNNVIGFVFASYAQDNPNLLCWYTAFVIGELYNVGPELECSDIMGQNTGCGVKSFVDQSFTCDNGSEQPGMCFNGQSTQNSFEIIRTGAGAPEFIFTNSFEAFEVPSAGPSP